MSRRARSRRAHGRRVAVEARGADALFAVYATFYRGRPRLLAPPDMERREFAVQPWGSSSYVRHLSFGTIDELLDYFYEKVPVHAYYSLARYEIPSASSMEEKGFEGADLMFDIDADHFPGCEGPLVSDDCIAMAAEAAWRLTRMAQSDLGADEVMVYYTGNRGFHIVARCPGCEQLGRAERREIAHYLSAVGLRVDLLFPLGRGLEPATPTPLDPGWRGKVGEWLHHRLGREPPARLGEALRQAGLRPPLSAALQEAVRELAIPLDLQVTQDTSRLLRIPGSLNGKTGLRVVLVRVGSLKRFRPRPSLSPILGDAKVEATADFSVDSFLGEPLDLRVGRTYRVPAYVGVALASRGLARLVEVIGDVELDAGWGPL